MKRCIDLASRAEGCTYPNPLVGSVLVHRGMIIGEGFHLKTGRPHAEVNAINNVSNREYLKSSTLYVNLEPCSHFGNTPPCADFIIENSIPRVVVGTLDTSEKVSGKGVAKLRDAGCEVITGVEEEECRRLNRRFFTFNEKKRPYVTLKWAQSSDGYLDIERKEGHPTVPNWITGKPERILVHRWRAMEQAILVGAGTVRADNPGLNVREWHGISPVRLILSSSGLVSINAPSTGTEGRTIVFTHNGNTEIENATVKILKHDTSSAIQVLNYLFDCGIQSLLVEGGSMILDHFISEGLWDEARVFTGQVCFNSGVKAPLPRGILAGCEYFSKSRLETFYNAVGEGSAGVSRI